MERALLYLGAFIAVAAAFRPRSAARAVEPALALGALVVTGYGAARAGCCPGIVHEHDDRVGGRPPRPAAHLLERRGRARGARARPLRAHRRRQRPPRRAAQRAAAAAAVPLAAGVYLSFSRGALAALAAGVIVLLVAAPSWIQLRAAAICLEAGRARRAGACAAPSDRKRAVALRDPAGADGARRGARALGRSAPSAPARPGSARCRCRAHAAGRPPCSSSRSSSCRSRSRRARRPPRRTRGETGARLSSVGSNRYEYWKVALKVAADHPLAGVGASGFAVEWLQAPRHRRRRPRRALARARDARRAGPRRLRAALRAARRRRARRAPRPPPRPGAGRRPDRRPRALGAALRDRLGLGDARAHAGGGGSGGDAGVAVAAGLIALASSATQRPLAPDRAREVDAGEHERLGDRLPERPLAAPEHEPHRKRRGRRGRKRHERGRRRAARAAHPGSSRRM